MRLPVPSPRRSAVSNRCRAGQRDATALWHDNAGRPNFGLAFVEIAGRELLEFVVGMGRPAMQRQRRIGLQCKARSQPTHQAVMEFRSSPASACRRSAPALDHFLFLSQAHRRFSCGCCLANGRLASCARSRRRTPSSMYDWSAAWCQVPLLNLVLSNSIWKGVELSVIFRQPFDLTAETTAIIARAKGGNGLNLPGHPGWLRTQS